MSAVLITPTVKSLIAGIPLRTASSPKIVGLFNGPPRCGKDTAVDYLSSILEATLSSETIVVMKISERIKDGTHAAYGMPNIRHDHFEDRKDTPLPEFNGLSPRQAYIKFDGEFKAQYGEDIFGKIMTKKIDETEGSIFLISDSGFNCECPPMTDRFEATNMFLVRVHMKDKDFSNDSREWIYLDNVRSTDIDNPVGRPDVFRRNLLPIVAGYIGDIRNQRQLAA